jgi:hypothetical protein
MTTALSFFLPSTHAAQAMRSRKFTNNAIEAIV